MNNLIQKKQALVKAMNDYLKELDDYQHLLEDSGVELSIKEMDKLVNQNIIDDTITVPDFDNWKAPYIKPVELYNLYNSNYIGEILTTKVLSQIDYSEEDFIKIMSYPEFAIIYTNEF